MYIIMTAALFSGTHAYEVLLSLSRLETLHTPAAAVQKHFPPSAARLAHVFVSFLLVIALLYTSQEGYIGGSPQSSPVFTYDRAQPRPST